MSDQQLSLFEKITYNTINTIQYLGSKKELLYWLVPFIESNTEKGDTILDVFAGTGSVGYALKHRNIIYSNDVQHYSYTINKAILGSYDLKDLKKHEEQFKRHYSANFNFLMEKIGSIVEKEQIFFHDKKDVNFDDYRLWCDNTPYRYGTKVTEDSEFYPLQLLIDKIDFYKEQFSLLFVSYSSNAYFGVKQCIEIDSIRYAIEKLPKEIRDIFLTALMSVMSYTVTSTTHFAQYLKVKDQRTFEDIVSKRKQDVNKLFWEKLYYLVTELEKPGFSDDNKVFNCDYKELFSNKEIKNNSIKLIYADPPYFKEHYSRYYHLIESLVLYNYPELTFNNRINAVTVGRYPVDRTVSDFGKKSLASKAFEILVEKSRGKEASLFISYSNNSIVQLDDIIEICSKYYDDVSIKSLNYSHSKQGRKETSKVLEYLIMCNIGSEVRNIDELSKTNEVHVMDGVQDLQEEIDTNDVNNNNEEQNAVKELCIEKVQDNIIKGSEKLVKPKARVDCKVIMKGRNGLTKKYKGWINQEVLIKYNEPVQDAEAPINIEKIVEKINSISPVVDNPISKMHNYLAKKPYNVIQEIIQHLSHEKEIVYDGFLGSGTTGYETLKANRKFIGIDINKVSINYFRSVVVKHDIDIFSELFNNLQEKVFGDIERLYKTICPVCSKDASIERLSFDREDERLVLKKVKYICHHCSPGRKSGIFIDARQSDIEALKEMESKATKFEGIFKEELLENKHIAIQPGATLNDYFCDRGKIALASILNAIAGLPNIQEKDLIYFTLSSSLHFFKLSDYKASSQVPYWQPNKNIVSRNPIKFLKEKFLNIKNGIQFAKEQGIRGILCENIDEFYETDKGAFIIHDSIISPDNKIIKDDSVSLIITDPPYSEQVPYLEYTGLWDKVLKLDNLTEEQLEKEIVVSNSPKRNKDAKKFKEDLAAAISEMSRVLIKNKYLCMFYHDFSLDYWKEIIFSANKVGLAFVTQVHVGGNQKSLKTVWNPNRTLSGSALVFFVKNKKLAEQQSVKNDDLVLAEQVVKAKADEIIQRLGGKATSQELYDLGILSTVIENNLLDVLSGKYKSFIQVFKKMYEFEEETGYWKLKNNTTVS